MSSIKCPACGMVNWSSAQQCKRCHAGLETQIVPNESLAKAENAKSVSAGPRDDQADQLPSRTPLAPAPRQSLLASRRSTKRMLLYFGLFVICVIAGGILVVMLRGRSTEPPPPAQIADIIQKSPNYRQTWNILINRRNEARSRPPDPLANVVDVPARLTLLPETLMLYHAGFILFHELGSTNASTELPFIMNEFTIEPKSKEIESQWHLLERQMAIGDSQVNRSSQWWVVPIGEREFGQISETSKSYDFGSSTNYVEVKFNWKWKPNEAGRALDKSDSGYTPPEDIIGRGNWSPADSRLMTVRDSKAVYDGYAKLARKDDGSYALAALWFADSPEQHWPLNQFNTDNQRHNMNVPGF